MKIKKSCEYCRIKNNSITVYENDEEQCPVCGRFLIPCVKIQRAIPQRENKSSTPQNRNKNTTTSNRNTNVNGTSSVEKNQDNKSSDDNVKLEPVSQHPHRKAITPVREIRTVKKQPVSTTGTSNKRVLVVTNKSIVCEVFENHKLVGMEPVILAVERLYDVWNNEEFKNALNRKSKEDRTISGMNILIVGDELTGRTEVAYVITELLHKAGIRSNSVPECIRCKKFESAVPVDDDLDDLFKDSIGKTVLVEDCLDEAFLDKDGRIDVDANKVNDILYALSHIDAKVTLIFRVTPELKEALYLNNPRVNDFFCVVDIPQYSEDNLLELAIKRITKDFKYELSEDAVEQLRNRIKGTSFKGYSQGRFILDVYQEARDKLQKRIKDGNNMSAREHYTFIKSDIQNKTFEKEKAEVLLRDEIDTRTGQTEMKAYAHKVFDMTKKNEERVRKGMIPLRFEQPNFIIEGDTGVGKTTACIIIAKLLMYCGILTYEEPYFVSVAELQTSAVGGTPEQVKKIFAKARGRLLVIDEAYSLAPKGNGPSGNYGQEVVDTITNELGQPGKDIVVVLVGYPNSIDPVLRMNIGMPSRFPNKIVIDDYSISELVDIFNCYVVKNNFTVENGGETLITQLIDMRRRSENFSNARGVINLADKLMSNCVEDKDVITCESLKNEISKSSGSGIQGIWDEVEALIGIHEVKSLIKTIVGSIKGYQKQKQAGKKVAKPKSYNLILRGPSGTGKTTVSRLIARLFSELGIIKYADKIIEKDGKDFIAGYVGQTEERVNKIIAEAAGGILYIDEVYQMDNGTEFGNSAINALCKCLDAQGSNLVVFISGYDSNVQKFLDKNEGLESRFPYSVTFNPYSEDELYEIFLMNVAQSGLRCEESSKFKEHIYKWIKTSISKPNFGYARSVRNLVEKCMLNLQTRVGFDDNFPADEMDIIKEIDIPDVA
jgi:stage V sporulation protein K